MALHSALSVLTFQMTVLFNLEFDPELLCWMVEPVE